MRLGLVKSYILNETPGSADFITFLKTFWDWNISPYIKEKLRKNHGIHKRHCKLQRWAVSLYWEEFFISLPTVKNHISNIYRKFGVSKRSEFMASFVRPLAKEEPAHVALAATDPSPMPTAALSQ